MTRGRLVCVAAAIGAVTATIGGPWASTADATQRCTRVAQGARVAYAIRQAHVGCRRARRNLRRWMARGFPHDELGWYCDMSHLRKLCAFGNGRGAAFVRFRLRSRR